MPSSTEEAASLHSIEAAGASQYLVSILRDEQITAYRFSIEDVRGVRVVVPQREYEDAFVRSQDTAMVYEAILAFHRACAVPLVAVDPPEGSS
jgi:hypothetical protein